MNKLDQAIKYLRQFKDYLYNPFESDNQMPLYYEIEGFLTEEIGERVSSACNTLLSCRIKKPGEMMISGDIVLINNKFIS